MNKLYKAIEWYTFEQAARRLSTTLGADVTESDITQLVIDEKLPLCWYLHMTLECVKAEFNMNDLGIRPTDVSITASRGIRGPVRLPLNKNIQIKNQLLSRHFSQEYNDKIIPNPVVIEDENGEHWNVMGAGEINADEAAHEFEIGILKLFLYTSPELGALGFRREDLDAFEESLSYENERRTSDLARENKSLSKLAYGMAVKKYAFDPEAQRSDVAKTISTQLAGLPENINIDDGTILKLLRKGSDIVKKKDK